MRGVYRAIDASINRVIEGLRVVEDLLRFHYNSQLWEEVKAVRLNACALMEMYPRAYLRGARDSDNDPGLKSTSGKERYRSSVDAVIQANLSRVKEALRTIEECSKLLETGDDVLSYIKELRSRLYGIERSLDLMLQRAWLHTMKLYFIADYGMLGNDIARVVEDVIKGGADVIQLRVKGQSDSKFLSIAREIHQITSGYGVPLIIDDRADIAVATGAEGVHVGQSDMPPAVIRKLYGSMLVIGMSVHNIEELNTAIEACVDYIGIGPVFSSTTKGVYIPPLGPRATAEIAGKWGGPYIAIGGISMENIDELIEAGVRSVAVISAIATSEDPENTARDIKSRLVR